MIGPDDAGYPSWLRSAGAPTIVGSGALLAERGVAVMSSRRCPPLLFFAAEAWASDESRVVIGGFQTPVEREMLVARVRSGRPVVVCPARTVVGMRIPAEHRAAVTEGRLAYVSALPPATRRATAASAETRNRLVAGLARDVVIVHAAPGSRTLALAERLASEGHALFTFDHPENAALADLGATILDKP